MLTIPPCVGEEPVATTSVVDEYHDDDGETPESVQALDPSPLRGWGGLRQRLISSSLGPRGRVSLRGDDLLLGRVLRLPVPDPHPHQALPDGSRPVDDGQAHRQGEQDDESHQDGEVLVVGGCGHVQTAFQAGARVLLDDSTTDHCQLVHAVLPELDVTESAGCKKKTRSKHD